MSYVKQIQNKIQSLEGGAFQTLFDAYLYKKYNFKNIQALGVQTGTNKPTKGIPDSYVLTPEGKYILINYGSVSSQPIRKIKQDIQSCFDSGKLSLDKNKISKIICGHCSTNIRIEQFEDIKQLIDGIEIELIGIDTISHDLALLYPHIAKDILGISIDTNQFFDVDDFIKSYDANGINAPLGCEFFYREKEFNNICKSIDNNKITVLIGPSGVGKTKLALEVCRKYDKKIKVYCIRSNGNLLYEDIRYYIDTPGEYLIYFDDANMVASWENVINTILSQSQNYKIKILISVRDYAKDSVIDSILNFHPEIISINLFTDNEVKNIIKSNLKILNDNYLDKIAKIANGNIRLAYLAGIRSINNGYTAITNSEDIFYSYYDYIIKDSKLNKEEILTLFFIAAAGPVRHNQNQLYSNLKNLYGEKIIEENVFEKLYSLELIDWFKKEITKISDQSLGNYILYYVLFKQKWVSLEKLISISFPKYKKKLIYILNTLMEIFYSQELLEYIRESIIDAWNSAPDVQNIEYLESFYQVAIDKSLSILKKIIDNEPVKTFDLHIFDFEKYKNYNSIKAKEIEILGRYKYTDRFDDALELLLKYYSKRPDKIMDFYFVICNSLLYDNYSPENNYNLEYQLINKLWEASENGNNYEATILYLNVVEHALKTEITYNEPIRNSKSFNFVTMHMNLSHELKKLRNRIWETLNILRMDDEYQIKVNKILSKIHFNIDSSDGSIAFLHSDFDYIISNIIDKNNLSFDDAVIIDKYREVAESIDTAIDNRYYITNNNYAFRIYKLLKYEYSIENGDQPFKNKIIKEIKKYKIEDFKRVFKTCCFLENKLDKSENWKIKRGLNILFEILVKNTKLYIYGVIEYLNANTPFNIDEYYLIKELLEFIGYDETYNLINSIDFPNKDTWLSFIWKCLNKKDITEKIIDDYKKFITGTILKCNPIIPSPYLLNEYVKDDKELKEKIVKTILSNEKFSYTFLENIHQDKDIETILSIFKDDITSLINIYINAKSLKKYHFDYNGKLFKKIFDINPIIWERYIDYLKCNINYYTDYEQEIFELIWNCNNWEKHINYAFKILLCDSKKYYINKPANLLFGKVDNLNSIKQKKQWLLNKLHENINIISNCKLLIDIVIIVYPEWKLEFILEFLKSNKKFEDFKKINLFPTSYSWSGSRIPIILERIDFLQSLKKQLIGIDYIDHKQFLEELCQYLKKSKEKIELDEYIENADYS